VGIALPPQDGRREELIIDPESGRVLGNRTVQVAGGAPRAYEIPVGAVTQLTATTTTLVNRVGQTG
jgi:hypothetical protein